MEEKEVGDERWSVALAASEREGNAREIRREKEGWLPDPHLPFSPCIPALKWSFQQGERSWKRGDKLGQRASAGGTASTGAGGELLALLAIFRSPSQAFCAGGNVCSQLI